MGSSMTEAGLGHRHDPAISIIVPVYNKGENLSRCLDSLLAQTFDDFEVLCVDDCSQDDSAAVMERYAAASAKVRPLRHDQNKGVGKARNTGLDNARGQYVTFVDADDALRRDALAKMHERAMSTDADVVVYDLAFCRPGEDEPPAGPASLFMSYLPAGHADPFTCDVAGNKAFLFTGASACTKLFARSLVEGLGLRFTDHPIAEDLLFTYTALSCAERVTAIEEPFYQYDLGTGSGNEVNPSNISILADVFSELRDRLRAKGLLPRYRDAFVSLAFGHFDNMLSAAPDAAALKQVFETISSWVRSDKNEDLFAEPIEFANDAYAVACRAARKSDFTEYLAARFEAAQAALRSERNLSEELRRQLAATEEQASAARAEAEALRASHSYKLGNLLVKAPAKVKRAISKGPSNAS